MLLHKKIKKYIPSVFHEVLFKNYLRFMTKYKIITNQSPKYYTFKQAGIKPKIIVKPWSRNVIDHVKRDGSCTRKECTSEPSYICDLRNAQVMCERGYVIHKKKFLYELAREFPEERTLERFYLYKYKKPQKHLDYAVLLTMPPEVKHNYWHWTYDLLPRLQLLKQSGYPMEHLLLNEWNRSFQEESLLKMGFKQSQFVFVDDTFNAEIKHLIVPKTPESYRVFPEKTYVTYMRKLFGCTKIKPHRLLFITREDATIRRIINEKELFKMLQKYGFEKVAMTGLPMEEQAKLFASAKVIVGATGTGFSNVLYCNRSCKIVALTSSRFLRTEHLNLFDGLSLQYKLFIGKVRGGGSVLKQHDYVNFIVDVPKIEKYIQSIQK